MRIGTLIITITLALIGIVLAISNRNPVTVRFDPFSETAPALSLPPTPLYLIIFGSILIGIIFGGLSVWISQGRWRRRAWKEFRHARKLEREAAKAAKSNSDETAPTKAA